MPDILKASIGDPDSILRLAGEFGSLLPGFAVSALDVDDETLLESEGVAYHWVDSDSGEVYLTAGFRTQEGDGEPLPPSYRPLLVHEGVARAFATLQEKVEGGWEPLRQGDLLVTTPGSPLRVRGAFRLWRIEDRDSTSFPGFMAVRRLRYLRDTAGGCAPGESGFRRLALPWRLAPDGSAADGENRLNSHAVDVVARLSRTHFHRDPPVTGGLPQWELYLVFDRQAYGLGTTAERSALHTFPDVEDWSRCTMTPLRPGDLVVIPPNTAHRGIDVLANVVAIPGFKPGNEDYVDHAIAAATGGQAPHNPLFAESTDPAGLTSR